MLLLENICVLCLEKVGWVSPTDNSPGRQHYCKGQIDELLLHTSYYLLFFRFVPDVVPGTSREEYMENMLKT